MTTIKLIIVTYTLFMFFALIIDALAGVLTEVRLKLRKLDIQVINNVLVIIRFITSTLHEMSHSIMIVITFGRLKRIHVDVGDADNTDINGLCVSKQRNIGKVADFIVDSLIGTAPLFVSTVILLTVYFNFIMLNITENNKEYMMFYVLELILLMTILFDTSSDVDLGLVPDKMEAYRKKCEDNNKEMPKNAYKFYVRAILYQKLVLIKRLSVPALIYSVTLAIVSKIA